MLDTSHVAGTKFLAGVLLLVGKEGSVVAHSSSVQSVMNRTWQQTQGWLFTHGICTQETDMERGIVMSPSLPFVWNLGLHPMKLYQPHSV